MKPGQIDLVVVDPPCQGLIIKGAAETAEVIGEFRQLLSDLTDNAPEIAQRLVDLLKPGKQLVRVQLDPESAATDMVVMRLDPTDGLLRLLAALRAGDRDFEHIGQFTFSLRGAA